MAMPKVKNLPDALFEKLRQRARRQRRALAPEVIRLLQKARNPPRQLSILDF